MCEHMALKYVFVCDVGYSFLVHMLTLTSMLVCECLCVHA